LANLLNVDVAIERILEQINPLDVEIIPLVEALGRVLAEDVIAEINLPPFANSAMDGFAVRADDVIQATQDQRVTLNVVMDIPAGVMPQGAISAGQCARIMTGAPVPEGADAVVPVEDTSIAWEDWEAGSYMQTVDVFKSATTGAAIRPVGENIKAGQKVLSTNAVLRPQDLGLLASLGHGRVAVQRQPRVVIISSGDELIGVDETLLPGKIRDVNSYTLRALVTKYGGVPIVLPPAKDEMKDVRRLFDEAVSQNPDMIISSAGASVGAADYIQAVVKEKGEINFWRINLRPGKPLAFGNVAGIPFFGLPGNPVSAMVTFEVLVCPALLKQANLPITWETTTAIVGQTLTSDGRRSYLRVKLSQSDDGMLIATLTGIQSSGALLSMVEADGLLIIPDGVTEVAKGTKLAVRLL